MYCFCTLLVCQLIEHKAVENGKVGRRYDRFILVSDVQVNTVGDCILLVGVACMCR